MRLIALNVDQRMSVQRCRRSESKCNMFLLIKISNYTKCFLINKLTNYLIGSSFTKNERFL